MIMLPDDSVKISAHALDVFYGKFQALKNVVVSIPPRKITAMIGPSGCGKSTLLRWLSGFKRPPRQTFTVHGEPKQAEGLARAITEKLRWNVRPAVDGETVDLLK